jgi:hypothetical protein
MKPGIFTIAVFLTFFSSAQAGFDAANAADAWIDQNDTWTPEEMKIVNQFALRTDDSRGIVLVAPALGNEGPQIDYSATSVKAALEYFMTTGFKKDIIYVAVADVTGLPAEFQRILDIHDVVRLYLIVTQ